MVELRDRLGRRVRRDLRDRRHAVGIGEVDLGVERVQRAARHLAQLVALDRERHESAARVEHREVDPELVEPFVEQARQVRGGAVERVRGGQAPPRRARRPELALARLRERAPRAQHHVVEVDSARGLEARREVAAADVLHVVEEEGAEDRDRLDDVAVGVDHRVSEPRAQIGGAHHAAEPSAERITAPASLG